MTTDEKKLLQAKHRLEQSAIQRIRQAYGEKHSHSLMQESKREVSRLLRKMLSRLALSVSG